MFYCEDCREKNDYPESISTSMGACEICGTSTICHDVPSSRLPIKEGTQMSDWLLKESPEENDFPMTDTLLTFLKDMKSLSHHQQILMLEYIAIGLSLDKTATAIRDSLNK